MPGTPRRPNNKNVPLETPAGRSLFYGQNETSHIKPCDPFPGGKTRLKLPSKCPQDVGQDSKKPCDNSKLLRVSKSFPLLLLIAKTNPFKRLQISAISNPTLSVNYADCKVGVFFWWGSNPPRMRSKRPRGFGACLQRQRAGVWISANILLAYLLKHIML